MAKLFILIGLPGAGKSTFAHVVSRKNKNIKYLSSDGLRKRFVDYKDDHNKIFAIMNKITIELLKKQNNVIYDSTNLERKYRLKLFNQIKANCPDTKVIAVFIHNGVENAIIQSNNRKNRNDVNESLIKDMYKTMQIPRIYVDCDKIMVPYIGKINNNFTLSDCKIYRNNKEFYEYVKEIDDSLCIKDIMEERKI